MPHHSISRQFLAALAVFLTLLLSACLPDDMPAYLDNGKSIAAVAAGKLWIYDVPSGKVKGYALPEHMNDGRMLGGQIWVYRENYWQDRRCWHFERDKKEFVRGPIEFEAPNLEPWPRRAQAGSWDGKKCIFVVLQNTIDPGQKYSFAVLSVPDLNKVKTVQFETGPIAAGGYWWTDGLSELFDDQTRSVLRIPRESADRVRAEGLSYGRLSADKQTLLLASVWQGGRTTFAVLDVRTGRCLWSGEADQPITGNPLVKRDEGWLLERSKPSQGVALVRYRTPEKPDTQPTAPETVLKYSLADDDHARQYNLSPDGKEFALIIDGLKPRLVFFPIRAGVTEKDLRVVELKETTSDK